MKYKIQALFMAFLIVFIPIYAAEAQAQFAEIPVLPGEACIDKVMEEREIDEDKS